MRASEISDKGFRTATARRRVNSDWANLKNPTAAAICGDDGRICKEKRKDFDRVFSDGDCIEIADLVVIWVRLKDESYPLMEYISRIAESEQEENDPEFLSETQIRDHYRKKFKALVSVKLLVVDKKRSGREKYYFPTPLLRDYFNGVFKTQSLSLEEVL